MKPSFQARLFIYTFLFFLAFFLFLKTVGVLASPLLDRGPVRIEQWITSMQVQQQTKTSQRRSSSTDGFSLRQAGRG